MNKVVVQLGRYGDLLSILPACLYWHRLGIHTSLVVSADYETLVRGLSYLTPVSVNIGIKQLREAVQWAHRLAGEIVVTQVDCNPIRPVESSFVRDQWARAGLLDRFSDLPLLLDNRDPHREAMLLTRGGPWQTGKPVVLVNTAGISSPYPFDLVGWLIAATSDRYEIVDLSCVRAHALQDLCGLYERARALITTDTATLHLSYATLTPTIALVNDNPWSASESRRHWVLRMTYQESQSHAGKAAILATLASLAGGVRHHSLNSPMTIRQPRFYHVVDWFEATGHDAERMAFARATWAQSGWSLVIHQLGTHQRSSANVGDSRHVPFVKDVFDCGTDAATSDDDVIVFTNADNCLTHNAAKRLADEMAWVDCCCASRIDVIPAEMPRQPFERFDPIGWRSAGTDLFAFRRGWWRSVRDTFPDLLLAYEGWDFVMRKLMQQTNPHALLHLPVVYHESHQPYWQSNVTNLPGQQYNRRLARAWAVTHGYEAWLHPGPWLFRSETLGEQVER